MRRCVMARPPVGRGEAQDIGVCGDDENVDLVGQAQSGRGDLTGCFLHRVDQPRGWSVEARHEDQHMGSGAAG